MGDSSKPCRRARSWARASAPAWAFVSLVVMLVGLWGAPRAARAQVVDIPPELEGIGVAEHLDGPVPMDARFRDHRGRSVRLGDYFDGERPVLLMLVYHSCPSLCSLVLDGSTEAISRLPWTAGVEYQILTISIDPRDTPEIAADKRRRILSRYNRPDGQRGWHFLVGEEEASRAVADAVGFQYRYDPRQEQYAHPGVIMLLKPNGHVARYLYGLQYDPNDLRIGLLEASEGRHISTVERVILYCYRYDPQGSKYVLVAQRVMRLGGLLTMLIVFGSIGLFWWREWRRQKKGEGASSGDQASDQTSGADSESKLG